MAPDTPVWQPAIFTRPERNMTISRLWVNYQCAELYPGLRTSPQCNVPAPTTPAGFETWADSTLRVASQRSNQLGQRVRPAGEKLAGRLDCHTWYPYLQNISCKIHLCITLWEGCIFKIILDLLSRYYSLFMHAIPSGRVSQLSESLCGCPHHTRWGIPMKSRH